jgi:tetratricopeptide (TPR) repeat protein
VVCLLLALATFAVYSPVRHYGFVDYDDPDYFFANSHVLGGLTGPNIQWAFTSVEDANWHPFTWLSLMLDVTLFGQGAAAPHVMNILLHGINSMLVFFLLRRLTGAVLRSAAVALLFAIHPLHVESVAWISERKDVLSAFFGLLTLLCYARYAPAKEENSPASPPNPYRSPPYWFALFFFACGLMSKPMVVTLPLVMLLLDYWPLERFTPKSFLRLLLEKIPFFLLSAATSVVAFIAQQKAGAMSTLIRIPLTVRVENVFISYARYLAKIILPLNLATPYPAPDYWPLLLVVLAVILFVALCVAAVKLRKMFPFVFTGWFWFAGMLVPVIGLVQIGGAAMADRYAYLPIIGILIVIIWGVAEICFRRPPPRQILIGVATFLFLACALRARNQVTSWENDESLFRHALSVTQKNYVADVNLGCWYSTNGEPGLALDCYRDALQGSPGDPTALYNVGNALAKLGHWDEAITNYRQALQITPAKPEILDNLGFALAQNKQLPEATACFENVLRLNPNSVNAHNNLATILFVQSNYPDAAAQYAAALQLSPDNPRILINLADTLVRLGQKSTAAQYYQRVLELQPDNEIARKKLQSLGPP